MFCRRSFNGMDWSFCTFWRISGGHDFKSSDQSEWVEEHLHSLYVVFVAIFFLSIGMLVDLNFVMENIGFVILMTLGVFILNSGINTLVLRVLGETWTMALLTGGLLSQIGELSFLLASLGLAMGMLTTDGHQMAIVVIAFSLMLSPLWMVAVRLLIREDTQMMADKGLDEEIKIMAKQLEQTRSHD
jgi:CPA2 family monovalent cation:H+ antiporter-2